MNTVGKAIRLAWIVCWFDTLPTTTNKGMSSGEARKSTGLGVSVDVQAPKL